MKKQTLMIILIVISIISILGIIGRTVGFFSTTYVTDDSGVVYKCGYYYDSMVKSNYDEAVSLCEAEGFTCSQGETSSGASYFQCQQLCYDCSKPDGIFLISLAPDCDGDSYYTGWGTAVPDSDAQSYYDGILSESKLETKLCTVNEVTCYRCTGVGTNVDVATYEDSCPSGWSKNIPTCTSNMVTCYKCDGETLLTNEFENTCSSGWTKTKPTCELDIITCYECDLAGNPITRQVTGTTCPTGLSSSIPNCDSSIMVDCFRCVGTEMDAKQYVDTCPDEFSSYVEGTSTCNTPANWLKQYIDFKEKPVESIVLIIAILILIYSIISTAIVLAKGETSNKPGF